MEVSKSKVRRPEEVDVAQPTISLRPPEVVWRRGRPQLMFSRVDSPMQTASLSERAPEIVLKRTLTNVGLGKRWDAKFVRRRVE